MPQRIYLLEEDLEKLEPTKIKVSFAGVISLLMLYFLNGKSDFFLMMICVLGHEAGHLMVMLFMKVKPVEITIGFLNLNIKYNKIKTSYKKDLVISLGGIGVNALFCTIGYFVGNLEFFFTNLILLVLNILPVKTLDGFNILNALRECKGESKGAYERLYERVFAFSLVFVFALVSGFNLSVVFSQVSALVCGEIVGN